MEQYFLDLLGQKSDNLSPADNQQESIFSLIRMGKTLKEYRVEAELAHDLSRDTRLSNALRTHINAIAGLLLDGLTDPPQQAAILLPDYSEQLHELIKRVDPDILDSHTKK